MVEELNRLITKYSGVEWESVTVTPILVDLLTEHRALIIEELNEVQSGERKLKNNDFLGPNTRALRQKEIKKESLYW